MASPRNRTTRTVLVLATAAAALLGFMPAQLSQAEPRPSITEVQRRVDALNSKIAAANEEYDGARLDMDVARRRAAVADARVRAARADLDRLRGSMAAVAAAAYRSGGADQFVQLITTSSPQTFLDRASSLDRIAAGQSAQLAAARTAQHRLTAAQADAQQQRTSAQHVADRIAQQRRTIEQALGEQQQLLSSLRADQRRQLQALQAARLRAARDRASRDRGGFATYNGPASGRAAVAVREAYAQLGKPYQWGAAGPNSFDCSGLTMWVWGKAGVSLPHQSRAQYAGGRKVAKSDLQPGDLTFYGSPIHHVGIYIGGGRMISAPQTGDVVKIQNALRSDYVGAVRP